MALTLLQIVILGLIQGAAELLPVSSSAHVIVAEKLMGLDPSSPEMTFLLVMLHTGTMFAVITYFWEAWRKHFLSNREQLSASLVNVAIATAYTLAIGLGLQWLIDKLFSGGSGTVEMEDLFSHLPLIAGALGVGGVLILVSGLKRTAEDSGGDEEPHMPVSSACWIGAVQGFAIPFRGFSRSGATISTGLALGLRKNNAEEFSFALAVVPLPLAIAKELHRLLKANAGASAPHLTQAFLPGIVGMVCSFLAGLLALRLLSGLLKTGRWWYFGLYSLGAAVVVGALALAGY